jgi:hypothetical protein
VQDHPDRVDRVGHPDLAADAGPQLPHPVQLVPQPVPGQPPAQVLAQVPGVGVVQLVLQQLPGRPAVQPLGTGALAPAPLGRRGRGPRFQLPGRRGRHQQMEVAVPTRHPLPDRAPELLPPERLVGNHQIPPHDPPPSRVRHTPAS